MDGEKMMENADRADGAARAADVDLESMGGGLRGNAMVNEGRGVLPGKRNMGSEWDDAQ